ncbi:E3 ubiquitin-protein ligase TRIM71-like isoform X1 [Pocillopora damicornis]|uniref:E3 ubiquitin-protein ligase TRIM71-like isoform X1 n=1 Tax=Pocillopora damicornis TaxID=46731 RepID=UPI000F55728F|nr:E3 ubiquitin-protein ligase TRIM71-like isoform X1 [Pocillopora damicornis]
MGKLNHRDEVFPKHKSKHEYEGPIRKHLKDEPRPMDKSYLGEKANRRDMSNPVDRRAPHESRNKEKSDTRHDTQRDENHGEGIGGVRSKNKLPLAPKQLRLEQPLKKVEKRSLTSQKQAASSGKSEFLSSLVKLKDALQSHSNDQKSTKEPLMSKSGADLNIQPCKDDATKKKGSPSAKPLPLKTDEVKEDATMWRITTTRKLAEFEHKMASVRDDLDINPMMDNPVFSTGSSVNLFCPLCHEMFVNPRLLPCLHTFCKRCLENLVVPRSSSLSCPACRTDVPLTERGVGAFPPNFVVTTMMDVAAVRAHDKNPIMCSSCEDKLPAAARCIECMDFLCHDCRNAHMRLRLTKTHRVVSLDELKSSPHPEDLLHRPIFCMEHAHEKLRYYCESCEQAICRECTMTSHSTERHKYTQLTDTIDKQTQNISQLVEKLKRKVPIVTQSTKDVEEVTCRLEARAEVAKSEIQKCFPRILKALQDREKGMMAEVETMVQRKSKVLGIQQERLENELKRLTTTCNFTEEVLRHGNSVEILVIKKQLCDRLNDLISTKFQGEPEENDVIYFVANQDEVLKALENLGQIKTSNAFPTNCTVADDMKNATKGRKSKFTVLTRDHSGAQCTGGGEDVMVDVYTSDGRTVPAEVEDHRNGSYGVSYSPFNVGMHKVSVTVRDKHIQGSPFKVNVVNTGESYLKFGKKGTEIGEFNGIFGVAVDDEGHIIITDCHNHRVQVFNQNGGFMFQFGRKGEGSGQFQCPTGVGVDPDGRIVVCERLGSRIQIFDRDGMFLHKFSVPDLKASTLAVDANRRIIVADSANRCIHVISLDTGQSFKFGSFGDGNGELNYPCYVAVNSQGHIIVSDMHSHRIQVFDPRGRFMFNFGRKGSQDGELMRPTGVAVGHDGNIIVADRDNHRIQVFSSEGRFVTKFGTKGDGDGQLNDPHGLALTPEGNIIVADFRNNRVQLFGQPA